MGAALVIHSDGDADTTFARVIGYGLVDERDLWEYTHPCDHGWPVKDCRCCTKLANECDWGSCNRRATTMIDSRLTCAGCAPMARDIVKCRAWSAMSCQEANDVEPH